MQTTSHFVWIQLNPEVFSDLFIKVFKYLEKNNIENILVFQNILSLHITLYYFEANLSKFETKKIQEKISKLDKNFIINLWDLKYFERGENKIIWYLNWKSNKNLETIFNEFNAEFQRKEIFENNLKFIPHITLFKIKNSEIYDKYKENIEKLIDEEIKKIKEIDIFTWEIFLYKVNSNFFGEIQIKT
jgi:2'-5' RNA ligase